MFLPAGLAQQSKRVDQVMPRTESYESLGLHEELLEFVP